MFSWFPRILRIQMKTNCVKQLEKIRESFPEWPESEPLDIQYQEKLAQYFCSYPTVTSELSFCGLFLFAERYNYRLSSLGDSLCVLGDSGGIQDEHEAGTRKNECTAGSHTIGKPATGGSATNGQNENQNGHAAETQKPAVKTQNGQNGQKFLLFPFTLPTDAQLEMVLQEGYFVKILPLHLRGTLKKRQSSRLQEASGLQESSRLQESSGLQEASGLQESLTLRIEESRDDFDYLYRRVDLAELKGSKYHKKRNHINHFVEHYQYHSEAITKDNLCDVFHVLNIWKEQHQSYIDYEATKKALIHFSQLPLFGQITYVHGEPAAFVLAEYSYKKHVVTIHLEKANIEHKGLYQYINKQFAQSLPPECLVINREQDLGDLGLRKSKESYRPAHLLKKFRVYPQTQ